MTTIRGRFFSLTEPGKSFIIRDTARKHFRHYVEINLFEDSHGAQAFRDVDTVDKFHLALSLVAGKELGSGKEDTIVFLGVDVLRRQCTASPGRCAIRQSRLPV